ncbi:inner membrane protein YqjK [Klebsiella pneumoniae]|uniref:Inner membrane protein YqjK n=2 Tax=Klebsiella pneumoniae TaxID=573 RepID=A0A447RSA3_KLEPN|nr:inner membrane protein YqjK [Klebsiella pneumoniae]
MNGRQERERQKTQLLRQIQQQRLELSACRRHWHEATAPLDRGWHTLLSLRSWLMVGSGPDGRMVRTTSAFFNALDQTRTRTVEHLAPGARYPAPVGSSLAALSVGAFPGAHALPFPCPLPHPVRSNMRLFRSAPFSTTPFTSRHTRTGGGPSRSVHFRLRVLIAQKL